MSPKRRITGTEERELLAVARRVKTAHKRLQRVRAERDQLIADLIDSNARLSDIADILHLSQKAVRDARDRAREH